MSASVVKDRRHRLLHALAVSLRGSDRVIIGYLAVEACLVLLFGRSREPAWMLYVALHAVLIAAVIGLVSLSDRLRSRWLVVARDWYPALYILIVFKLLGALVPAVHPRTYDGALLAWDRALFGSHPGSFFDALATPAVTEILRACWLSYFLLPIVVALPLYLRPDRRAFHETVHMLLWGWLISYLGYYAVPALGPGYFPATIPAPAAVSTDGVTRSVALALFALEGRMFDIFPSGHAIIALLVLWQAARQTIKGWMLLVPVVAGLLIATVFLRYHYGVDVVAGVIIAGIIVVVFRLGRRHSGIERGAAGSGVAST